MLSFMFLNITVSAENDNRNKEVALSLQSKQTASCLSGATVVVVVGATSH